MASPVDEDEAVRRALARPALIQDVRAGIESTVELPRGYHVEYGGQFESAEEAVRTLVLLGIAVIAGIFLLLYLALKSSRDAALVMVNLPLALAGGAAGVFLSGGVLSVASIIGFITLFASRPATASCSSRTSSTSSSRRASPTPQRRSGGARSSGSRRSS